MYVYNSLTNQKEVFKPIQPNKIRMYVCGMTVYDDCHIGHARTNVAFDVIVRYFRFRGFDVTFVRNITDVDDKIINRARENNETTDQLVARTIESMYEDFDRLNILRPDFDPRATEMIDEMCQMIQTLVDKGYAYKADNGDVYYRVKKFAEYGKLSKQNLDNLQAGARIEVDTYKENPLDFVLWKASKPGEPSWPSPWGQGRPGWHIECSAMSKKILGAHFDIHGGGSDLRFPHHENEIAQSEAANHCAFANYWMHSGMVQVNAEKMSKSLNNFFTIKDVLKQYHPEVIRFFLVFGQYRSEINYSQENLVHAKASIERLYTAIRGLEITDDMPKDADKYLDAFTSAMDNDFNTPEAISVLFTLAKEVNKMRQMNMSDARLYANLLHKLASVLGLLKHDAQSYFADVTKEGAIEVAEIETLINQRLTAKKQKDWVKADDIRNTLAEYGIVLEDTPDGTTWKRG
ncbi:cysteine--tRNA ligase [Facilibium subflavum]